MYELFASKLKIHVISLVPPLPSPTGASAFAMIPEFDRLCIGRG